ncbi:MAG: efflux RND transporter permease subunit [bacterium]
MWLTNLSIRRPIFILMIMTTFIVLGLYSYLRMKTELQPNVSFPMITIITAYPGAGPEEIELQVSKRIEDAVSSTAGVKAVDSISREGASIVIVEFNLGTNLDTAFSDARSKVDSIRQNLPKDSLSPSISKLDANSAPVLYVGISSKRPSQELRDLADDIFKDKLGRVSGVASVAITGGDEREILVALKPDRLIAYGITPSKLLDKIREANLDLPAGHIVEGNKENALRFDGKFKDVDQIRNLKINLANIDNPNSPGPSVPLSSIATIQDTIAERREINRLQGQNSLTIIVQKSADANTVQVVDGVKKEIEGLKLAYSDIKFEYSQDQGVKVNESLLDLRVSLFLGIILVVLIIYLFLHSFRGTLIVSLAIPTSIFATFIVMYFAGFTINSMTMLALSLAVGILVDDAIVVLENIYRHLNMGEAPAQAAINGRSEIGLAAITITLIDVVVFVPVAFMGGIVGEFFRSFGITVAAATLFSLFVSFTLTPMLASRWYKQGENTEELHGFFLWFETKYHALLGRYRRILNWALDHRWLIVLIGFGALLAVFNVIGGSFGTFVDAVKAIPLAVIKPWGVIALIFYLLGVVKRKPYLRRAGMGFIALGVALALATVFGASFGRPLFKFRFAPDQDQGTIQISLRMPPGASLEMTDAAARKIEAICIKTPDVKFTTTIVGATTQSFFGAGDSGTRFSEIDLTLNDKASFLNRIAPFLSKILPFLRDPEERFRSDQVIVAELREKIGQVPGAMITISAVSGFGHFGAPIQVAFYGTNLQELTDTANKAKQVIASVDGILYPDISWTAGQPEYRAEIDRDKANDLDVSATQIASNLRIAYEGNTDIKFRQNGKEYPIRVRLGEQERNNLAGLSQIPIAFRNGSPVWLSSVTNLKYYSSPTKIQRHDRNRQVVVLGYLATGKSPGNMQLIIDKKLADAGLPPPGIKMDWQGENKMMGEEMGFMFQALLLAFILVYILMASLFDNLLTPLIIMLAQPQAMVGALLALVITNVGFSIVAMIGVIMLVGLVGKNAILLVDYTNTLRERGLTRRNALLEAGPTRLRPILMTTSAMVLAMIPVALAIGRGSEFRAPLGIAVIGGLILSTVLTLVVIPCIYTIFDDLSNWISRTVFKRQLAPVESEQEPVAINSIPSNGSE